jgi:uncharacterized protein
VLPHRTHLFSAVLVWTAILSGAETPIPEAPTQWVTDTANFLSPDTVRTLNDRLRQYEQRTGHQLIVYIAPTTGGVPIEDWAVRAFAKWKVGRKRLDDGLAVFVMPQDRKVRIEVGYGLEPVIPDAIASRVINEVMVPRIQAGKPDAAITEAIDALTGTIDKQPGAFPAATPPAAPARERSVLESLFWKFIGILILALIVTHPRLAFIFLISILSGGRGYRGGGGFGYGGGGYAGGGFGGGGFGGAGGRSGGGGASGSW